MEKNKNYFLLSCITGASGGIGAELCVQLAKCGAVVIGLARRVEKIEELNEK